MSRTLPDAPATHFRLSAESRAKVEAEYRAGRTAPVIGAKWRISPSTVYRWAREGGWTKRDAGDAAARAHAQAVEAEEAEMRERRESGAAGPAPLIGEADCAGESADLLAATALRGVRNAFMQGRLEEAASLAKTADVLTRVAAKGPDSSLETIFRALVDEGFRTQLFSLIGDWDNPLKREYWDWADGPEVNARREQADGIGRSWRRTAPRRG